MESEIKLAALLLRFRLWLGFVSPNGLRCRSGLIVYESEWHCLETLRLDRETGFLVNDGRD
ncbi:hypothetical protein YC2023_080980 [Brassica napus]